MTIWEVFTLLSIYRQIPLAWPVTFAEGLRVGIYLYLLILLYLLTWGGNLPISPDAQMGWEFTHGYLAFTHMD